MPIVACWDCNPVIWKTSLGWHPNAETCRSLRFVINCILLGAFLS